VDPRAVLDWCGKSRLHRDSIPGRAIRLFCLLLAFANSFISGTQWRTEWGLGRGWGSNPHPEIPKF
jgi:hypothetical protein